jgi:hypothetical protein
LQVATGKIIFAIPLATRKSSVATSLTIEKILSYNITCNAIPLATGKSQLQHHL